MSRQSPAEAFEAYFATRGHDAKYRAFQHLIDEYEPLALTQAVVALFRTKGNGDRMRALSVLLDAYDDRSMLAWEHLALEAADVFLYFVGPLEAAEWMSRAGRIATLRCALKRCEDRETRHRILGAIDDLERGA